MSENVRPGTSTSANVLICYGDDATPIGAIQKIEFARVKGGGVATIERIVFDGVTLADLFGTPDDPNGKTLWIQDVRTGVHFMFEDTEVESVTTTCTTEEFAIREHMVLSTLKPVKRIKVKPDEY